MMWSRFGFGKGKNRPAEDAGSTAPDRGATPADVQSPWYGQPEAAACDAALDNLLKALPVRLTLEGRVHAETCLAAIGAIAGFSAQRSLFEYLKESRNAAMLKQLRTAKTRTGSEYYFGEPLNRMLVPSSDAESNRRLWSLAAAGAIRAGLSPSDLPDLGEMFAHVATALVGEAEGWPSVARAHQPHMNGRETLQIVWPVAMDCFDGRAPNTPRSQAVSMRHWPAIAGRVAAALIQKTTPMLDPRTALIIVMESAIYASKVKPAVASAAAA